MFLTFCVFLSYLNRNPDGFCYRLMYPRSTRQTGGRQKGTEGIGQCPEARTSSRLRR